MKQLSYEQFRKHVHKKITEYTTDRNLSAACDGAIGAASIRRFAHGQQELTGPKIHVLADVLGVQVIIPKGGK